MCESDGGANLFGEHDVVPVFGADFVDVGK